MTVTPVLFGTKSPGREPFAAPLVWLPSRAVIATLPFLGCRQP